MSRLAFVLFKYFPYGGLQRDFMAIAMAAVAKGFTVDVYVMRWEGPIPPELNVITIKSPGFTNHQKYCHFIRILQQYRDKTNYQAIVGFNKVPNLDFYYAADPCFAIRKKFWFRFIPRYRGFLDNEYLVFARDKNTFILALSKIQVQQFQHYYLTQSQRFHILPPWLTDTHFQHYDKTACRQHFVDELGLPSKAKWLLQVGSGFRTKGLDRSLKALASLSKNTNFDVCLIIIGQDKQNAFKRLARQLGVASKVFFLGGRKDVAAWMHAADVLIHPAYAENAGYVLIEAIIAGLPVLTTSVCGYAEYVTRAKAGLVLPEPFSQLKLDVGLLQLLTEGIEKPFNLNDLQPNLLRSMPEQVITLLENYQKVERNKQEPTNAIITDEGWIDNMIVSENHAIIKKSLTGFRLNWTVIFSVKGYMTRKIKERETLKIELTRGNYYLKRFMSSKQFYAIWTYLFNKSEIGALPEYSAIKRLTALAIPTLILTGFGIEKKLAPRSFLITKEINGVNLEQYTTNWLQIPPSRSIKLAIISQLATTIRVLHHYGINHRDCYLCHFWLNPMIPLPQGTINNLSLVVMDLHRAQIRKQVPLRWKIKDLSGLLYSAWQIPLTMRDLCRAIEIYTGQPWRQQLIDHKRFWQLILKKAIRLRNREHRVGLLTPGNAWLKMMLAKMS